MDNTFHYSYFHSYSKILVTANKKVSEPCIKSRHIHIHTYVSILRELINKSTHITEIKVSPKCCEK